MPASLSFTESTPFLLSGEMLNRDKTSSRCKSVRKQFLAPANQQGCCSPLGTLSDSSLDGFFLPRLYTQASSSPIFNSPISSSSHHLCHSNLSMNSSSLGKSLKQNLERSPCCVHRRIRKSVFSQTSCSQNSQRIYINEKSPKQISSINQQQSPSAHFQSQLFSPCRGSTETWSSTTAAITTTQSNNASKEVSHCTPHLSVDYETSARNLLDSEPFFFLTSPHNLHTTLTSPLSQSCGPCIHRYATWGQGSTDGYTFESLSQSGTPNHANIQVPHQRSAPNPRQYDSASNLAQKAKIDSSWLLSLLSTQKENPWYADKVQENTLGQCVNDEPENCRWSKLQNAINGVNARPLSEFSLPPAAFSSGIQSEAVKQLDDDDGGYNNSDKNVPKSFHFGNDRNRFVSHQRNSHLSYDQIAMDTVPSQFTDDSLISPANTVASCIEPSIDFFPPFPTIGEADDNALFVYQPTLPTSSRSSGSPETMLSKPSSSSDFNLSEFKDSGQSKAGLQNCFFSDTIGTCSAMSTESAESMKWCNLVPKTTRLLAKDVGHKFYSRRLRASSEGDNFKFQMDDHHQDDMQSKEQGVTDCFEKYTSYQMAVTDLSSYEHPHLTSPDSRPQKLDGATISTQPHPITGGIESQLLPHRSTETRTTVTDIMTTAKVVGMKTESLCNTTSRSRRRKLDRLHITATINYNKTEIKESKSNLTLVQQNCLFKIPWDLFVNNVLSFLEFSDVVRLSCVDSLMLKVMKDLLDYAGQYSPSGIRCVTPTKLPSKDSAISSHLNEVQTMQNFNEGLRAYDDNPVDKEGRNTLESRAQEWDLWDTRGDIFRPLSPSLFYKRSPDFFNPPTDALWGCQKQSGSECFNADPVTSKNLKISKCQKLAKETPSLNPTSNSKLIPISHLRIGSWWNDWTPTLDITWTRILAKSQLKSIVVETGFYECCCRICRCLHKRQTHTRLSETLSKRPTITDVPNENSHRDSLRHPVLAPQPRSPPSPLNLTTFYNNHQSRHGMRNERQIDYSRPLSSESSPAIYTRTSQISSPISTLPRTNSHLTNLSISVFNNDNNEETMHRSDVSENQQVLNSYRRMNAMSSSLIRSESRESLQSNFSAYSVGVNSSSTEVGYDSSRRLVSEPTYRTPVEITSTRSSLVERNIFRPRHSLSLSETRLRYTTDGPISIHQFDTSDVTTPISQPNESILTLNSTESGILVSPSARYVSTEDSISEAVSPINSHNKEDSLIFEDQSQLNIAKRHTAARFLWLLRLVLLTRQSLEFVDFGTLPRICHTICDDGITLMESIINFRSMKNQFEFPNLKKLIFGPTIDCRYVVPFLDFCKFPLLRSVQLLGLTLKYEMGEPQFGAAPTMVFGPQQLLRPQIGIDVPLWLPAVYNGPVDEALRLNGRGVYVSREYLYEGSFIAGRNDGYGRMSSNCGEIYEGWWLSGRRHGNGVVIQTDGRRLEGTWVKDKLHGRGSMTLASGLRYEGDWCNGVLEGWAVVSRNGSLIAVGQFVDGRPHGWTISKGSFGWFPDKSIKDTEGGQWETDLLGERQRAAETSVALSPSTPISLTQSRTDINVQPDVSATSNLIEGNTNRNHSATILGALRLLNRTHVHNFADRIDTNSLENSNTSQLIPNMEPSSEDVLSLTSSQTSINEFIDSSNVRSIDDNTSAIPGRARQSAPSGEEMRCVDGALTDSKFLHTTNWCDNLSSKTDRRNQLIEFECRQHCALSAQPNNECFHIACQRPPDSFLDKNYDKEDQVSDIQSNCNFGDVLFELDTILDTPKTSGFYDRVSHSLEEKSECESPRENEATNFVKSHKTETNKVDGQLSCPEVSLIEKLAKMPGWINLWFYLVSPIQQHLDSFNLLQNPPVEEEILLLNPDLMIQKPGVALHFARRWDASSTNKEFRYPQPPEWVNDAVALLRID